ncbi:hypothetical protein D3C81_1496250 [compost metagenome]
MACVKAKIAPLEAAYASVLGSDINERVEDRLTTAPPAAFFRMILAASRVTRKTLRAFVLSTLSHSSTESSYSVLVWAFAIPALFIRISMVPYLRAVCATTSIICSSLLTSQATNSAVPPVRVISSAASCPRSAFSSAITTFAPSAA